MPMQHWWKGTDRIKGNTERNTYLMPLCPPQITPHIVAWDRNRVSAVRGWPRLRRGDGRTIIALITQ
jgi:hypothetical protein